MGGYLLSFTVYTLAMIGVILIGYVVARKSLTGDPIQQNSDKFLKIESSIGLEPRKNIYVVKAGNERFLISTDQEGSHFLTKLDSANIPVVEEKECIQHAMTNSPILNLTKSLLKNATVPNRLMELRFVEKLNSYVTFQKP